MRPDFDPNEVNQSQLPVVSLLCKINEAGTKFHYLTHAEALELRGGKANRVLLTDILQAQLNRINTIKFRRAEHKFSAANIKRAITALEDVPLVEGPIRANELTYDLLRLGKSFDQTIEGDTKGFTLRYIDWEHPENNVFHVTTEYDLMRAGSDKHCYLDVVLFVNGIPFVNIECKAPGIGLEHAISNVLAYQSQSYVPEFYKYVQLVIAVNKNEAKYATAGTEAKFWAVWKSREALAEERGAGGEKLGSEFNTKTSHKPQDPSPTDLQALISQSLDSKEKERVGADFVREQRAFYNVESAGRQETEQDRTIYELCRPFRLLELTQKFVVFDGGIKKIARYQQYYAVKNAMARFEGSAVSGARLGGVIWHTQGSGKSLTMVMLANAIAMSGSIENPRIVLVTDRVDLDKQLSATFKRCGLDTHRASSGADLGRQLLGSRSNVVTTLVQKFEAALKSGDVRSESREIFVLVDESHRTQYGSMEAQMKRTLPNACYIGFTGTPLMRNQKRNTVAKYGGLIDTYTMRQAIDDKAVVPLLYERRHVEQIVQQGAIDTWFERICQGLTPEQKKDLKKKYSRAEPLTKTQQRLRAIAFDIYEHFRANWKGTEYKAQLVTPDKKSAIFMQGCLDEIGSIHDEDERVTCEVVISRPDEREGYEEVDGDDPDAGVEKFWAKKMAQYGSEERYVENVIGRFNSSESPDILIVVDKLITGFDVPRNTVLYLTRRLQNHTLLQAIARVNRLYEGKDFGFILDYIGILGELDRALCEYAALAGFDQADLEGAVEDIRKEVLLIPAKYAELLDLFREVGNPHDQEEYERLLQDDDLRKEFKEKLSAFSRALHTGLSTEYFYELESQATIQRYKSDLKRFLKLRRAVEMRYGDVVDMKKLEPQIEKLLDTYVTSDSVELLTPQPIDIMDTDAMEEALASLGTPAARADGISNALKRTITERMDEDPALYRKFSIMIEETIRSFRDELIGELDYLRQMRKLRDEVVSGVTAGVPKELDKNEVGQAYFRVLTERWPDVGNGQRSSEAVINLSLKLDSVIRARAGVVDWRFKQDILNGIRADIDDVFYKESQSGTVQLDWKVIDEIAEELMRIAKSRLL